MNDSAPPPPAPSSVSGNPPQSWQTAPAAIQGMPPPAFDPRRAMAGSRLGAAPNPGMAPPPANAPPANAPHYPAQYPAHSSGAGPTPYVPPAPQPSAYPGTAATGGPSAYAPPPFPEQQIGASPHAGHHAVPYDPYQPPQQMHQPAYDYPAGSVAVPIAAQGRPSLLSRLTRRKTQDGPAPAPASADAASQAGVRKPFFMGLLTGVVLMLILGQVFRAANSGPDYAALPSTNMTIIDEDVSAEPTAVAFLDTVEGLD